MKEMDMLRKSKSSKNLLKKGFKKLKGKIQVSIDSLSHCVLCMLRVCTLCVVVVCMCCPLLSICVYVLGFIRIVLCV